MPTTTISINVKDKRDVEALKLFENARSWAKCVVNVPGVGPVKAYGIPSRSNPNVLRLTNLKQCNCEDFLYRQDGGQFKCAHMRAVKWFVNYILAERRKEQALAAEEASRREKAEADYRASLEYGTVDPF